MSDFSSRLLPISLITASDSNEAPTINSEDWRRSVSSSDSISPKRESFFEDVDKEDDKIKPNSKIPMTVIDVIDIAYIVSITRKNPLLPLKDYKK